MRLIVLLALVFLTGCAEITSTLTSTEFWLGEIDETASIYDEGPVEYPYPGYYYLGHYDDPFNRYVSVEYDQWREDSREWFGN